MRAVPSRIFAFLLLVLSSAAAVASEGTLAGRVLDAAGEPAAGVHLRVAGTPRVATSDAEGRFDFGAVPAGSWLIEAESARHGRGVAAVAVLAGEVAEVEIRLAREVHGEEVVVTASPEAARGEELARPVSVLGGDELMAAQRATLGETLAGEPGVHSTWFGPGASRPVIRGMGGDRIRVLEAGLGVGDVSTTSPDHAVGLDTMTAERIEIVRGPATLLYGASAVGGVVNVLDESIPSYLPEAPLSGEITLRGATNGDERAGAAVLTGALGRFAWHLDASRRDIDDIEIPGPAEREGLHDDETEPEESADGVLPNSALESESRRVGLSWIGRDGFVGLSVGGFDTLYGVPGHAHAGHEGEAGGEEEDDEAVRVDLRQRRVDLRAELRRDLGPIAGFKVRLGTSDYEHRELEGEEVGTRFLSDGFEGRVEARHRPLGRLSGAWGVQAGRRDFEALGEEAFVPPSRADQRAVFIFEELPAGDLTWQFGLRHESQVFDVRDAALPDRSFSGVSGSLGLLWSAGGALSANASLSRSVGAPNPEALYANGPHAATRTWEIGDPELGEEVSTGFDFGAHLDLERVHVEASLFYNRIDDFVHEALTGEQIDGLSVVTFRQADARTWGGELSTHLELIHRDERHLDLDLSADWVRAELVDGGDLPRIPPLRWSAALVWHQGSWSVRGALRRVERQERVAAFESETAGYSLIEASVGRRLFLGRTVHDLQLVGTNLGDEEGRVHVSWIKDLAPLPGRDVRLTWRVAF